MTPLAIVLVLVCQVFLIAGQILLKRAMTATPIGIPALAGGITCLAGWFFIWITLLARWDLSRLYPFEGLDPALIVAGSAIFLHEDVKIRSWIGVALISLGVAIIAM